jgi:hypothetical protein
MDNNRNELKSYHRLTSEIPLFFFSETVGLVMNIANICVNIVVAPVLSTMQFYRSFAVI